MKMKKISDREYIADEGKIIVSKMNNLRYKKIKLSNNDTIENYKEIKDISSISEKPIEIEPSKKWGRKND